MIGWRRLLTPDTSWPPTSLAAVGYASVFGLAATYVAGRATPVRDAWLGYLSTNLVNLADHPVRALVGSAFVTDDVNLVGWTALAFVGLAAAGRALGNLRLVGLVAATHVVGTLVSEGMLAEQIRLGAAPASARFLIDVGPSYVVAPALVLGILYGSTIGRVTAGLGFAVLAPDLFGGLPQLEVSSVGHVVAIGLALLVGPALVRDRRASASIPRIGRWSSKSPASV